VHDIIFIIAKTHNLPEYKLMSSISLENITVNQGQQTLLRNLSLSINEGQHWLLVGESGSGKTVLLNAIAGRLRQVSGVVEMSDRFKNRLTLVTSRHHFSDKTNTSTNLYYQQRYNSSDSDQALTVQEYLQSKQTEKPSDLKWSIEKVSGLMRLDNLMSKEVIKLSNGETKRLRLAAALLKQPVVLLLDDPLSGLDHQTQEDFGSILQQIIDAGTMVIMSGSGYEIPTSITHVAVMHQGTITDTMAVKDYRPGKAGLTQSVGREQLEAVAAGFVPSSFEWIVKMSDVTVKYGEHTILNRVNWQVKPGEHWALFGHNGAGKSTLLSLINGDNPQAYANDILLFDKKRGTGESIWDIKRNIGFLSPELYQYFPTDQSGLQVVESGYYDTLGLFRPSNKAKAAKAMEWLNALGIEQYARQPLKDMPANAQRLCLLARALIKMPPLLILDEPCQGLDKQQRIHFNGIIDAITEVTGVTLIYVTHYANELPSCISRVLTLDKGEVVTG
jgi:molybdate transport system ATP-binding protein